MEHLLDDLTKNIKTIIASGQDNSSLSHVQSASNQENVEGLSRVFLYFVNCPGIQGFLFLFLTFKVYW
jgi:hypothetical protein